MQIPLRLSRPLLRSAAVLALLGASGCGTGPEEEEAPREFRLDPAAEAQVRTTWDWLREHRVAVLGNQVEMVLPGTFRPEVTFDTRGAYFNRVDRSTTVDDGSGGPRPVLETVLEAGPAALESVHVCRVLLAGLEVASTKKILVTFDDTRTEVEIDAQGDVTWWIGAPEQRRRAPRLRIRLPGEHSDPEQR